MVRVIEGKIIQKWSDGKQKLFWVSGRSELLRVWVTKGKITENVWMKSRGNQLWFELARVRVIGSQLYFFSSCLIFLYWVLLFLFGFCAAFLRYKEIGRVYPESKGFFLAWLLVLFYKVVRIAYQLHSFSPGVNKPIMWLTSDANDSVNAKSHTRELPLLREGYFYEPKQYLHIKVGSIFC